MPDKHLQCDGVALTKIRHNGYWNELYELTAQGRTQKLQPAKKEHVRHVRKLPEHFQCDLATFAKARRNAHWNELCELTRWKEVRSQPSRTSRL